MSIIVPSFRILSTYNKILNMIKANINVLQASLWQISTKTMHNIDKMIMRGIDRMDEGVMGKDHCCKSIILAVQKMQVLQFLDLKEFKIIRVNIQYFNVVQFVGLDVVGKFGNFVSLRDFSLLKLLVTDLHLTYAVAT